MLIPVQCEYYALEGLSDLMTTMRAVKRRLNPKIEIFGVLLTMYDGRTNFSAQVAEEVRRHFPGKVFASMIPRNVRLSEAPATAAGLCLRPLQPRCAAYLSLAEEILKKLKIPEKGANFMTKQRGLGRGWARFGETAMQTAQPPSGAQLLPLQKVEPNPLQPRKSFDPTNCRRWPTHRHARHYPAADRAAAAVRLLSDHRR